MELVNRTSVSEIIYLATDDENTSPARFQTMFRYIMRAIEEISSIGVLSRFEDVQIVKNGQVSLIPDYFWITTITVNDIPCFTTTQAHTLFGNVEHQAGDHYVYELRNGKILFEKPHSYLENQKCLIAYRVWDKNENGDILVPAFYQEALIAFIEYQEVKRMYLRTGRGRGAYQDAKRNWELLRDKAIVDAETPDEAERQLINRIWNTKLPLSNKGFYTNNRKV